MTSSSRNKPKDPTRYAVAASKGLSYWLPKSAQSHLQSLLKQLPFTARSIYKEQYRDVMCERACAAASAVAMAEFVLQFPKCAKMHNAFAREMNAEIESEVHVGYEPVLFPIVDEPESESDSDGGGEDVEVPGRASGKRRQSLDDADASKQKVKNDQGPPSTTPPRSDASDDLQLTSDTQYPETPELLSDSDLPPADSPPSEDGAVLQEHPFQSEDSHKLPTTEDVDDRVTTLSITEDPIARSLPTQAAPPSPPTQQRVAPSSYHAPQDPPQPHSNSAEIDVASPAHSFIIGDVNDHTRSTSKSGVHNAQPVPTQLAPQFLASQHTDAPREQNSPRGSLELLGKSTENIGHDSATNASSDAPVQLDLAQTSPPPPSDQQIGAPSISHTPQTFPQPQSPSATDELLNPPYDPYVPFPEDVTWEEASAEIETFDWDVPFPEDVTWDEASAEIETFDWDKKGSKYEPGRGLLSVHYLPVGPSAGLFKGNFWDKAGDQDGLFGCHCVEHVVEKDAARFRLGMMETLFQVRVLGLCRCYC